MLTSGQYQERHSRPQAPLWPSAPPTRLGLKSHYIYPCRTQYSLWGAQGYYRMSTCVHPRALTGRGRTHTLHTQDTMSTQTTPGRAIPMTPIHPPFIPRVSCAPQSTQRSHRHHRLPPRITCRLPLKHTENFPLGSTLHNPGFRSRSVLPSPHQMAGGTDGRQRQRRVPPPQGPTGTTRVRN